MFLNAEKKVITIMDYFVRDFFTLFFIKLCNLKLEVVKK